MTPRTVHGLRGALDRASDIAVIVGVAALLGSTLRARSQDSAFAKRLRAQASAVRAPVPVGPRVSILVAAWNEADGIDRHLRGIRGLRYANREYILCAGGADGTYERARMHASDNLIVLEQHPGEGKQRALARAFEHASGTIIYLTDADCVLDDESFERVLEPLLDGEAAASTSTALRPVSEQQESPFVGYQWCTQFYVAAHTPRNSTGLLGMNCAVQRATLESAGGFGAHVATGTDYYLAKRIVESGGTIAHVGAGYAQTEYPDTWQAYARQQSRWLRNVALHGRRSESMNEVALVLRTSAIGLSMLILPVMSLMFGRSLRNVWLLALIQSVMNKWRYCRFAEEALPHGNSVTTPKLVQLVLYSLGEFLIWTMPLAEYLLPSLRKRW